MFKDKIILGLNERIKIKSPINNDEEIIARIDTGATNSSIDINLAGKLNLGPIIKTLMIKSTHGKKLRPVIELEIKMADKTMKAEFTLADRGHMKFPVLIGQNILKEGFIIDPSFMREEK